MHIMIYETQKRFLSRTKCIVKKVFDCVVYILCNNNVKYRIIMCKGLTPVHVHSVGN